MKGHRLDPHQRELGINRRQIPKTRLLRCPRVAEKARQARIRCCLRIVAKQYKLCGGRQSFEPPSPLSQIRMRGISLRIDLRCPPSCSNIPRETDRLTAHRIVDVNNVLRGVAGRRADSRERQSGKEFRLHCDPQCADVDFRGVTRS
jgi:hypothetical protein